MPTEMQVLKNLVDHLSSEQRAKLREFGVDNGTITKWRTGDRLPTEPQVAALAEICGVDRHTLQDEVALLRATPEQRRLLERVMGKARGAVVMLICGVSVAVACAALGVSGATGRLFAYLKLSTMYRAQKRQNGLRPRCTTSVL